MRRHTNSFIIKDGKICEVIGVNCKLISSYEAKIDDWECALSPKGLTCYYVENTSVGKTILKYSILKNGLSRLVLKAPNSNPKTLNKKWLSKPRNFDLNGTVILSDGNLEERIARFKKS